MQDLFFIPAQNFKEKMKNKKEAQKQKKVQSSSEDSESDSSSGPPSKSQAAGKVHTSQERPKGLVNILPHNQ